jgi:hypothetical protein
MVKHLALCILLTSSVARAAFLVGFSTNTWQEKIPIVVASVPGDSLTSFSSFGASLGFDYLYDARIRYALVASYLLGNVDIHKLDNAVSPRRNFMAYWVTNKLHWRMTKSFSLGPSVVLNYRKIDGLDMALSSGAFLDFDYDLTDVVRLTQSLGTMSDS